MPKVLKKISEKVRKTEMTICRLLGDINLSCIIIYNFFSQLLGNLSNLLEFHLYFEQCDYISKNCPNFIVHINGHKHNIELRRIT